MRAFLGGEVLRASSVPKGAAQEQGDNWATGVRFTHAVR